MSDCIILGVMLRRLGFSIWLLLPFTVLADQTQISNYSLARDLHWQELYVNGGWTLYCGESFQDNADLFFCRILPADFTADGFDYLF